MSDNVYSDFALLPMTKRQSWGVYGLYETVADKALNAMADLGFCKVDSHCVYAGDIAKLLPVLAGLGWSKADHPNPYLLGHADTCMLFNYALTADAPDVGYVSFFRG